MSTKFYLTIGNLVTDAIVKMSLKRPEVVGEWTRVSAAIWNGGGIRSPIKAGKHCFSNLMYSLQIL